MLWRIRQTIASGWARRRVRVGVCGVVAVAGMITGAWLIAAHIASLPPDPATDDPREVVAYFLGPHFEGLSEADRRAYVRGMLGRYAALDAEQRELVSQQLEQRDGDRGALRERMLTMWKDYIVTEAEEYVALPPERRGAWLEQRAAVWRTLAGVRGNEGGFGERSRRSADEHRELTPDRQRRIVGFFQDQVVPRSTARERALVTLLVRDIQQHAWE